jgi:hypothetical protein
MNGSELSEAIYSLIGIVTALAATALGGGHDHTMASLNIAQRSRPP